MHLSKTHSIWLYRLIVLFHEFPGEGTHIVRSLLPNGYMRPFQEMLEANGKEKSVKFLKINVFIVDRSGR